ncbi:MAG: endonuclease III [archaeon]
MPKTPSHLSTILQILSKKNKTSMLGSLHAKDPYTVLIATMLSARSRDETTAQIIPELMHAYPTPKTLASAKREDVERIIKKSGFYRQKTKNIQAVAKIIYENYKNHVPESLEALMLLPGVGRKTACCVLVYAHNIPEIPVDVHVQIISRRLGWTNETSPDRINNDLKRKIPRRLWLDINELFVSHGKSTCTTFRPKCSTCSIAKYCQRRGVKNPR